LLRAACEVTPPSNAPAFALRGPGLKRVPPFKKPTKTITRAVSKAVIRPEAVRQPKGFFFKVSPVNEAIWRSRASNYRKKRSQE
jgi:hypothetical protein